MGEMMNRLLLMAGLLFIPMLTSAADLANGERISRSCALCHGLYGQGTPGRLSPRLAGMPAEYLFKATKDYTEGVRINPTMVETSGLKTMSDKDLEDIAAYYASLELGKYQRFAIVQRLPGNVAEGKEVYLDDVKVEQGARFVPPRPIRVAARPMPKQPSKQEGLRISDITQTVAQIALKPGVTKEDAIEAMLSRAVELNLKLVGRQNVSKELEARGVETPYLTILQFCNPMDARVMVMSNPVFSSYMPCRISLVEDGDGKAWLMMLNLDMLIDSELLPTEVVDTAIKVNQQMLDVMVAGATGEF